LLVSYFITDKGFPSLQQINSNTNSSSFIQRLVQNSPLWVLLLVTGVLAYLGDPARELFRYHVEMQNNGEWWRLWTANLVHTNVFHWLLNSTGLILIWWIFHGQLKPLSWSLLLFILAPAHLALLYWLAPELRWYVGLSGLLHGWLATAAIFDVRGDFWVGYLLLAGLIAKVSWEMIYGASAQVTELIHAHVATEAHLAGVIVGILLGLLWPNVKCMHCDGSEHSH